MNRRSFLKFIGAIPIVGAFVPRVEPIAYIVEPIAYIVMADTFDCDLKTLLALPVRLDPNYVNRAWHVYWAHRPGAKEKFEKAKVDYRKPWYRNVREILIYDHDDWPEWVRDTAKSLTNHDQFHCFKGYSLVVDHRGFPKYDASTIE